MQITDLISQHLPEDTLIQIAQQAGISSPQQGAMAGKSAIQTILQGMSNNAGQAAGVQSILGALDRDHDGSILNDIFGMVNGQQPATNPRTTDGSGILGHILGNRQDQTVQGASQILGIEPQKMMSLLVSLAPVVMGLLGKMRANNQINETNIQNVLGNATQQQTAQMPGLGVFSKLLDQDGDGNITDDLLQMGMKYFSNK